MQLDNPPWDRPQDGFVHCIERNAQWRGVAEHADVRERAEAEYRPERLKCPTDWKLVDSVGAEIGEDVQIKIGHFFALIRVCHPCRCR